MTATQAPTPGPLSGKRYRKKPVVIEAIQWTGDNLRSVITFTDGPPDTRSHHANMKWEEYADLVARDGLRIFTREDGPDAQVKHYASVGDFIIRGVQGELYACKPDIFAATYEPESLAPTAPVEAPSTYEEVLREGQKERGLSVPELPSTAPVEASGSEIDERTGHPTHYSHRPQPSGETREALDRLKMAAHVYEDDEMAADCATLEALLSARPLALGGQS